VKLIVPQLLKKYPVFNKTRRFITVFAKKTHYWTVSHPDESSTHSPALFLSIHFSIIPSVAQTAQCRKSWWSVNDKFRRMWRKRSWPNLRYIAALTCLQGLRKTWNNFILMINFVPIHLTLILFTQLQAYSIPNNRLAEVTHKRVLSRVVEGLLRDL
jgi:hypothetical protein